MSSPWVCSFMGSIVNGSSFAVISLNNAQLCCISYVCGLVQLQWETHGSAMSFQGCCVKSSTMCSPRCVTVFLHSWRALIEDNISSLFSKSRNKESAAWIKDSFIIFQSWKAFLCLIMGWLTWNNALLVVLAFEVSCVENAYCLDTCDTSLCLRLLLGRKSVSYFFFFLNSPSLFFFFSE